MNSSKDSIAIDIENVGIKYSASRYKVSSFKEWVLKGLYRDSEQTISALSDISFQIRRGESVGLIGHNGSGKSTLLKVLAGIAVPKIGRLKVIGRIAPLIELGAGFDIELSGLENIKLSCMLMGLTAKEIKAKENDIIDFAELRDFIDIPLKAYSSGMHARLGFACATAIEPDILLVDEVLAVGDSNFHSKCLEKIRSLQKLGTTIILVSHDLPTVQTFCSRAILLSKGKILFDGDVAQAAKMHEETMEVRALEHVGATSTLSAESQARLTKLSRNSMLRALNKSKNHPDVKNLSFHFEQNQKNVEVIDAAKAFKIVFDIQFQDAQHLSGDVSFGIGINAMSNVRIGGCNNLVKNVKLDSDMKKDPKLKVRVVFEFSEGVPELSANRYRLVLGIHDGNISRDISTREVTEFIVINSKHGENQDLDILALHQFVSSVSIIKQNSV
jgi:ABC-type polysaccharide/polyol phosphate transport system ATPase subunit